VAENPKRKRAAADAAHLPSAAAAVGGQPTLPGTWASSRTNRDANDEPTTVKLSTVRAWFSANPPPSKLEVNQYCACLIWHAVQISARLIWT
jgi:hypothetical protein